MEYSQAQPEPTVYTQEVEPEVTQEVQEEEQEVEEEEQVEEEESDREEEEEKKEEEVTLYFFFFLHLLILSSFCSFKPLVYFLSALQHYFIKKISQF